MRDKIIMAKIKSELHKVSDYDTLCGVLHYLKQDAAANAGKKKHNLWNHAIKFTKERINRINRRVPSAPNAHNNRRHKVTDHALVQYLRRAHGVDIEQLKDRIVEQNNKYKILEPVINDGVVITFIPRSNGDQL